MLDSELATIASFRSTIPRPWHSVSYFGIKNLQKRGQIGMVVQKQVCTAGYLLLPFSFSFYDLENIYILMKKSMIIQKNLLNLFSMLLNIQVVIILK